jgi:hypothetical protein
MSIAEDMKALTDSSVDREKNNPASIAKNIFKQVLAQIEVEATAGSYRTRYEYTGVHWRSVNEALVPLLVAEGFFADARNDGVTIRWDEPKKRIESELAARGV